MLAALDRARGRSPETEKKSISPAVRRGGSSFGRPGQDGRGVRGRVRDEGDHVGTEDGPGIHKLSPPLQLGAVHALVEGARQWSLPLHLQSLRQHGDKADVGLGRVWGGEEVVARDVARDCAQGAAAGA